MRVFLADTGCILICCLEDLAEEAGLPSTPAGVPEALLDRRSEIPITECSFGHSTECSLGLRSAHLVTPPSAHLGLRGAHLGVCVIAQRTAHRSIVEHSIV